MAGGGDGMAVFACIAGYIAGVIIGISILYLYLTRDRP